MGALVGIAIVAGMVTAVSPCVLPVLPILFAGSAAGSGRRPFAVVGGLVVGFTAFTLGATALLDALGLPDDLLRNVAIGVVVLLAISLIVPQVGALVERPFARLARGRPLDTGSGFLLGLSLGLLFTPCAGPVIAAVAVAAATQTFSLDAVVVTLAYALGAGLVLLVLAILIRRGVSTAPLRAHAVRIRQTLGVVMLGAVAVMILGLDTRLASRVPSYTRALQGLEESALDEGRLTALLGSPHDAVPAFASAVDEADLEDYGRAPEFQGIAGWLNSPPLTLAGLRGRVVLIDFWTYSCVNCLRTLPHLRRWDAAYRDRGLTIVGVHTPEFAFERDAGNVASAVDDLDVRYPVALDPEFGTWNAWFNRYWPAKYLIDRRGHLRYVHFGEGEYQEVEDAIRTLLAEAGPDLPGSVSGELSDLTPNSPQTPETYLGYERAERYEGSRIEPDRETGYTPARSLSDDGVSLAGRWTVEGERAVAGRDASLALRYRGSAVHLVLGPAATGPGRIEVLLDGRPAGALTIDTYRLYTLAETPAGDGYHELELAFSRGVSAYAFTFGAAPAP